MGRNQTQALSNATGQNMTKIEPGQVLEFIQKDGGVIHIIALLDGVLVKANDPGTVLGWSRLHDYSGIVTAVTKDN